MHAVFFDFDGTLFDTRADIGEALNHTRRDFGLADLSEEAVRATIGRDAKYQLEHGIPECAGADASRPVPFGEIWERFIAHYYEHCCERVRPYPGVERTLDELRRRGWGLGVNTNKPREAVERILAKFGLSRFFGEALVAGGDPVELKPSADSLRACVSRLGGHVLAPTDWMVGDNWTDMECAANAGVKGAFCAFGFGFLGETSCALRLDRFDELLDHLR